MRKVIINQRNLVFLTASILFIGACAEERVAEAPADEDPIEDVIGSSDGLTSTQYRIFVSSNAYDGALGGVAGADATCQVLASAAGLTRTYKALLSETGSNAADRIVADGEIYIFSDATTKLLVANTEADLWNVTVGTPLLSGINIDENFSLVIDNTSVWSGSDAVGNSIAAADCLAWTDNSAVESGEIGYVNILTDGTWIDAGGGGSCDTFAHLYCISQ